MTHHFLVATYDVQSIDITSTNGEVFTLEKVSVVFL